MTASLTALATRLGVDPGDLDALAGLTDADVATLDAAVRTAMEADARAVDAGFEHTLKLIPRPLRGRAAKALGV